MGTDITMMAEVKGTGRDRWRALTDFAIFDNPYYTENKPVSIRNVPYLTYPCIGRNYQVFSKLADVRNEPGLTGEAEKTYSYLLGQYVHGDRIEPLAEPRGIPNDASSEWLEEIAKYEDQSFAHSYFTLAELEKFREEGKFDDPGSEAGWVTLENYIEMRDSGESPRSWSKYVGGPGITLIPYGDLQQLTLGELRERAFNQSGTDVRTYVEARWARDSEDVFYPIFSLMEQLRNRVMSGYLTADQVRLVFMFDN